MPLPENIFILFYWTAPESPLFYFAVFGRQILLAVSPPAILRELQYYGWVVGAAYMPPVASIPAMHYNG